MTWLVELVPYGEDAVASLPDELLLELGWCAGDEIEIDARPGRLLLHKRDPDAARQGEAGGG